MKRSTPAVSKLWSFCIKLPLNSCIFPKKVMELKMVMIRPTSGHRMTKEGGKGETKKLSQVSVVGTASSVVIATSSQHPHI